MSLLRRAAVAAAVLGLALTGCGSSGGPASEPTPVPGANLNGKLTIGIPFDQPGIGMKDGDTYTRLRRGDREVRGQGAGGAGDRHHLEGVRPAPPAKPC